MEGFFPFCRGVDFCRIGCPRMYFSTLNQMIVAIREIEPSRGLLLFGSSSLLASFPNQTPETLGVLAELDVVVAEVRRQVGNGW